MAALCEDLEDLVEAGAAAGAAGAAAATAVESEAAPEAVDAFLVLFFVELEDAGVEDAAAAG